MSGVSMIGGFTLGDAARTVTSAGIGLAIMNAVTPRLLLNFQILPGSTAGWVIQLLVLSAGIWLGRVIAQAVLGRM